MNYFDFLKRFFKLESEVGQLEVKVASQRDQINSLQKEVDKLNKNHSPQLILTTNIFNFKIKILAMTVDTQDFVDAILALEDTDTKAPITATFANIVLTSSDPTIFTADTDVDADGTLDIVGIAEGSASLNVTADATYTDSNTGLIVTASKSADVPVTVTKPAPGAENTDLVVTFTSEKPVVPVTP